MSKATKEELKKTIEDLPQSMLARVARFIRSLAESREGIEKKPLQTYQLGGKLDDVNIRSRAYDQYTD